MISTDRTALAAHPYQEVYGSMRHGHELDSRTNQVRNAIRPALPRCRTAGTAAEPWMERTQTVRSRSGTAFSAKAWFRAILGSSFEIILLFDPVAGMTYSSAAPERVVGHGQVGLLKHMKEEI